VLIVEICIQYVATLKTAIERLKGVRRYLRPCLRNYISPQERTLLSYRIECLAGMHCYWLVRWLSCGAGDKQCCLMPLNTDTNTIMAVSSINRVVLVLCVPPIDSTDGQVSVWVRRPSIYPLFA